jgi:hypothetical protein
MKIFKRGSMMQEHRTKPKNVPSEGTTERADAKGARFYENVLNFEN